MVVWSVSTPAVVFKQIGMFRFHCMLKSYCGHFVLPDLLQVHTSGRGGHNGQRSIHCVIYEKVQEQLKSIAQNKVTNIA